MTRLIVQSAVITDMVNAMQGRDTDWNPVRKRGKDWERNPNFMRMHVPGVEVDVALLGPWDSMLGMFLMVGTAAISEEKWAGFQALRFSASPLVSSGWDFISGRDFDGNRTRDTGTQITKRLLKNVQPFFVQNLQRQPLSDLQKGYQEKDINTILRGAGRAGLQFLAVKATPFTFGDITADIIRDLSEKGELQQAPDTPLNELTPEEQRQVKAHPDFIKAQEAKREISRASNPISSQDAQAEWIELRKVHDKEITDIIQSGQTGKSLRLNLQRVMRQRAEEGRVLFEILGGAQDEPDLAMFKGLHESYWSIPLEIDDYTGRPDFSVRDQQRNEIVRLAVEKGFEETDIRDRFDFSENSDVNEAIQVYHLSQDLLKSYWTLTDTIVSEWPLELQEVWARYDAADDAVKPILARQFPFVEALSQQRKIYRAQNPEVDYLLVWWGYAGKPVTAEGTRLQIERAREGLGIQ